MLMDNIKQVIVFSTVRSNSKGQLGFVSDPRRMNVALTRAKRGLIVVGNSKTLESDKHWAIWLAYMRENNLISVVISDKPKGDI
jgi:regulator of nonsense transcripts 1